MKIKSKLIIGYLMIAILAAALGVISNSNHSRITHSLIEVSEHTLPTVSLLQQLKIAILEIIAATSGYEFLAKKSDQPLSQGIQKALGVLNGLSKHIQHSAELDISMSPIRENAEELIRLSNFVIESTGNTAKADIHLTLKLAFEAQQQKLNQEIDRAIEIEQQLFVKERNHLQTQVQNISTTTLLFDMLLVISALLIGWYSARKLSTPIHKLRLAAQSLANRELNTRIKTQSNDELGELAETFNNMANQLESYHCQLGDRAGALEKSNRRLIQEIHDRIESEKERRVMRKELAQAQKMQALGTLSGGIAHDFNNILSIMIGNIDLVLLDEKEPELINHLHEARAAGLRAKDLVQQILLFSRRQEVTQGKLDIDHEIYEVLRLLRATLPSSITFKKQLHPGQHLIWGNAVQIHQILVNLCSNAKDAMEEHGGVITISTDKVALQKEMLNYYPGLSIGQYFKMTVSDSGPGIHEEDQHRIFEPFFTTKALGKGTGMGLSVVHGIVKQHHGHITVTSKPGQGTHFEILLPLIEEPTQV